MKNLRLDDLYRMIAHIYSEQNTQRSASATFAHFVEVCGMLTVHERRKKREGLQMNDALCKALGWYFPLMAKFRVRSVEEIIYRKYPYVCPYCRKMPHKDSICKTVMGTASTVDHSALRLKQEENRAKQPKSLDDWQKMFQEIYPRSTEDRSARSTLGLMEELGELAEAIRVFDRHPRYFAGEAADVFSYIMGIANEHAIREQQDNDRLFSFESEIIKRYPGLCIQCGYKSCICPAIPESTVGRMAKELPFNDNDSLFLTETAEFSIKGAETASMILESFGGYSGLAQQFPFDRGEANKALILLSLRLAEILQEEDPEIAQKLHGIAFSVGKTATYSGSKTSNLASRDFIDVLKSALREIDSKSYDELIRDKSLTGQIGKMLTASIRVLLVLASPSDQEQLMPMAEARAIEESIRLSPQRSNIEIKTLPAATADDVRRALLYGNYNIVHFSGHSDMTGPVLESEGGMTNHISINALKNLFFNKDVECVILSGCESIANLNDPIAPVTIGTDSDISIEAAIEFARGFYDAIGAGKSYHEAFEEGILAADLKNLKDDLPVKMLPSRK